MIAHHLWESVPLYNITVNGCFAFSSLTRPGCWRGRVPQPSILRLRILTCSATSPSRAGPRLSPLGHPLHGRLLALFGAVEKVEVN